MIDLYRLAWYGAVGTTAKDKGDRVRGDLATETSGGELGASGCNSSC